MTENAATYPACSICRTRAEAETPSEINGVISTRYHLTCEHAGQAVLLVDLPVSAEGEA